MADPLATILRLRRDAANTARRALAEATRQETKAGATQAALRETLAQEAACVPAEAVHPAAETFARWLPQASRAIEAATQACQHAAAARDAARHEFASRQGALKAAAFLSEQRRAAELKKRSRKDQKTLDEIGQR